MANASCSRALLRCGALFLLAARLHAGDAQPLPDKSAFTLLNPTPRALMREMTTDRPDINDSPRTVDAGHFQIEMDFAAFTTDRHNPERVLRRVRTWEIAPMYLKVGLLNSTDLELGLQPYTRSLTVDGAAGTRTRAQGWGDVTLRSKINLWGNDHGETAFALIPSFKVPTANAGLGNRAWEGGLSTPFAAELPHGFEFGVMPIFNVLRNDDDRGNHFQAGGAVMLGRALTEHVDGLVEFIGLAHARRDTPWEGVFNTALTWNVTKDWHLDAGVRIGVTRAADDWRPFLGMSWRY
jgi:hypothetical protein